METIRRKMQEQYDLKTQEFAVKQKEVRNMQADNGTEKVLIILIEHGRKKKNYDRRN